MKTLKNGPQNLLIIGPNLLFHSPTHSQQPKIDFSYHKNVPPSICSLICVMNPIVKREVVNTSEPIVFRLLTKFGL